MDKDAQPMKLPYPNQNQWRVLWGAWLVLSAAWMDDAPYARPRSTFNQVGMPVAAFVLLLMWWLSKPEGERPKLL